jgi:hypothetical protein
VRGKNPLRRVFAWLMLNDGYLHTHVGSAAPVALRQRATSGELHVTSQRLPSLSALHELVARVELVVVVVPPAFVELVTLVELLELTELVTLVELLASIELVAAADTTFSAEPHAHSASATTVMRYLIVQCSNRVRPSVLHLR